MPEKRDNSNISQESVSFGSARSDFKRGRILKSNIDIKKDDDEIQRWNRILALFNGAAAELARQREAHISRLADAECDPFQEMLRRRIIESNYVLRQRSLEERFHKRPGDVYAFGTGDTSQLGIELPESNEDLTLGRPEPVPLLKSLPVGVVEIACGGLHNVAVTASGRLFAWGCNDDGAVGRGKKCEEQIPLKLDEKVDPKEHFVTAAAGSSQTLAITHTGRVYMWGSYKDDGRFVSDGSSPDEVIGSNFFPSAACGIENALKVACGEASNGAILRDGSVVTWGIGLEVGNLCRSVPPARNKETGENNVDDIYKHHVTPKRVEVEGDVKIHGRSVACGSFHMLVVADNPDGEGTSVWSGGLNNYGQLGHGDTANSSKLKRIAALDRLNIVDVSCGLLHSLFIARDGKVFACGRGDSGQLGVTNTLPDAGHLEDVPLEVKFPNAIGQPIKISSGDYHNFVITNKNEAFSWGFGENDALGHGERKDIFRPKQMSLSHLPKNIKVLQLSGGGQHSLMLTT